GELTGGRTHTGHIKAKALEPQQVSVSRRIGGRRLLVSGRRPDARERSNDRESGDDTSRCECLLGQPPRSIARGLILLFSTHVYPLRYAQVDYRDERPLQLRAPVNVELPTGSTS
ncbi:MAG: hypothetical protein ACTH1G_02125, partial [Microbacterium gubbeenense]